jgi:hypothetical protein
MLITASGLRLAVKSRTFQTRWRRGGAAVEAINVTNSRVTFIVAPALCGRIMPISVRESGTPSIIFAIRNFSMPATHNIAKSVVAITRGGRGEATELFLEAGGKEVITADGPAYGITGAIVLLAS